MFSISVQRMKYYGVAILGLATALALFLSNNMQHAERVINDYTERENWRNDALLEILKFDLLQTEQREFFEDIVELYKEIQKSEPYSKVLKSRIVPICDSLNIQYSPYQSNMAILKTIVTTIHYDEKYYSENRISKNLKLLINTFEELENDSIKVHISLFSDYKELSSLDFFDNDKKIQVSELHSYSKSLDNMSVKNTNPVTGEVVVTHAKK